MFLRQDLGALARYAGWSAGATHRCVLVGGGWWCCFCSCLADPLLVGLAVSQNEVDSVIGNRSSQMFWKHNLSYLLVLFIETIRRKEKCAMNSTEMAASLQDGHMSLETLWRLLEHQRKQNASMASVVGLDEAKILIQNDQRSKHGGMTTLGKNV